MISPAELPLFAAVIDGSLDADRACVLLRHMAKTTPWKGGPLDAVARRATGSNDSDMLSFLERGQPDIMGMGLGCDDQVKVMLHLRNLAWDAGCPGSSARVCRP